MARVVVEFSGQIEINTQGWSGEAKLQQIKKQAQDEVSHWQFMVKKGALEPEPIGFIKAKVTHVILPIDGS